MDNNQVNKAYAEQYAKDHNLVEKYSEKQKPLSDEQIHDIWKSLWEGGNIGHIAYNYARAIEKAHGIQ